MAQLGFQIIQDPTNGGQPSQLTLGMTNIINIPIENHPLSQVHRLGEVGSIFGRGFTKMDFMMDCVPNNIFDYINVGNPNPIIQIIDIGFYNPFSDTYTSNPSVVGQYFRRSNTTTTLTIGANISAVNLPNTVYAPNNNQSWSDLYFMTNHPNLYYGGCFYLHYKLLNTTSSQSNFYHCLKINYFGQSIKKGWVGNMGDSFEIPYSRQFYPLNYMDIVENSKWKYFDLNSQVDSQYIQSIYSNFPETLKLPQLYPLLPVYNENFINKIYFLGFRNSSGYYDDISILSGLRYNGNELFKHQSIPINQLILDSLTFNNQEYYDWWLGDVEDIQIDVGFEDVFSGNIWTYDMGL